MGGVSPEVVALAAMLPVGVLLTGADGTIRYANPALGGLFGEPSGRAAASHFEAADGQRRRCTLPDGRILEGIWQPFAGGRCLTVSDVTAGAHIRRRLREHNRALAELVATKTELVSALLHEVRTPLTAARSMAALLPSHDPVIEGLQRNLGRLEDVTREIATISGIENGTLDVRTEAVDLGRLLGEVTARPDDFPAGPMIEGDPALLGEVFRRLIAAVRAVGGDRVETDGNWQLRLPLPPDTPTDRLFTRGNATALMYARAVLSRHGGSVGVEDECLTVRLPPGPRPGSAGPPA